MRLLAIDTALEACTAALGSDGQDFVRSEDVGRGHAERLFGLIAAVLAAAGLAPHDLDRIAVTVGPGSFTGIRIGIAAARGLALTLDLPAVGVSTLAVHAESALAGAGGHPVLALLDAKRDEVYGQLFGADGAPLGEPAAAGAAQFARLAAEAGADLAGSGAPLVAALIGPGARILHARSAPEPSALLRLAARSEPGAPPRPLYLRAPDAVPRPVAAAVP